MERSARPETVAVFSIVNVLIVMERLLLSVNLLISQRIMHHIWLKVAMVARVINLVKAY